MCIVTESSENQSNLSEMRHVARIGKRSALRRRGIRLSWMTGAAALAPVIFACKPILADYSITLPSIGSAVYNVTVSNSSIDGGAVAQANGTSFNNTTVINDFLAYAAAHGGGTVEIPANSKAYGADELFVGNNVDLDIETGATVQNLTPKDSFLSTINGTTHDVEVSGGGILNDAATGSGSNHMCTLENITSLAVSNVTIENSSQEHLVAEADSNVLINNVTIQDTKTIANTDGIDFSGSNFLIENCHVSDDDDDIVAKPESVFCSNIYITNDTITNGHGISIGGQTNAGLNGMYVNNVTENMASASNAVGIHLKAGDGTSSATQNGGPVRNVTFNNITINNVDDAISVDSYYNNGSSNLPSIPAPNAPTDATEPIWNNVTFENIKINNVTSNAAQLYGLNSSPPNFNGANFLNITATNSKNPWQMYYLSDAYLNGVTVNGTAILNALGSYKNSSGKNEAQEADDTFSNSVNAIYSVDMPTLVAGNSAALESTGIGEAIVAVPEPGTLSLLGLSALMLIRRRRGEERGDRRG
jgi:hypothetical protein